MFNMYTFANWYHSIILLYTTTSLCVLSNVYLASTAAPTNTVGQLNKHLTSTQIISFLSLASVPLINLFIIKWYSLLYINFYLVLLLCMVFFTINTVGFYFFLTFLHKIYSGKKKLKLYAPKPSKVYLCYYVNFFYTAFVFHFVYNAIWIT